MYFLFVMFIKSLLFLVFILDQLTCFGLAFGPKLCLFHYLLHYFIVNSLFIYGILCLIIQCMDNEVWIYVSICGHLVLSKQVAISPSTVLSGKSFTSGQN